MANWYDDPNALPLESEVAPSATVNPNPLLSAYQRGLAGLNPDGTPVASSPALPSALPQYAGTPDVLQGLNQYLAQKPKPLSPEAQAKANEWLKSQAVAQQPEKEKEFFDLSNTAGALWDAAKGLGTTVPAAYYQLTEGTKRPDQWSPEAKAAIAEQDVYRQAMEEKTRAAQAAGDSDSVSESIREAGGSLGFSLGAMGAALPAGWAGAKAGAALGAATPLPGGAAAGGLIGGFTGAMAGSGAGAYRMAYADFMGEAFKKLEEKSLKNNQRPMTEEEKAQAYTELSPVAENTALWEAGPEAIGNAATLGAGGLVFGWLGKEGLKKIASNTAKRVGLKAAALTGGVGTEVLTEGVTQFHQGNDQAKLRAYLEGLPMDQAQPEYEGIAGFGQAIADVAPQTLALVGMMGGAAGGVKVVGKAYDRYVQDPKRADALLEVASNPDVRKALPNDALANLDIVGEQLVKRFPKNESLAQSLSTIREELLGRTSEAPQVAQTRQQLLDTLYQANPKLQGLFGKTEAGAPQGGADVRGLQQVAPKLGALGLDLRKLDNDLYMEKMATDAAQGQLNQEQSDFLKSLQDAGLLGATETVTPEEIITAFEQGRAAVRTPAAPPTEPSLDELGFGPPTPPGTPPALPTPAGPHRQNIADRQALGSRMLEEALAQQQAAKASSAVPTDREIESMDDESFGKLRDFVDQSGLKSLAIPGENPISTDLRVRTYIGRLNGRKIDPTEPLGLSVPSGNSPAVPTPTPGETIQLQRGESIELTPPKPGEPVSRITATPEEEANLRGLMGERPGRTAPAETTPEPPGLSSIPRTEPPPPVKLGNQEIAPVAEGTLQGLDLLREQARQVAQRNTPADRAADLLGQIPGMLGEQQRLEQEGLKPRLPTEAPLETSPAPAAPQPPLENQNDSQGQEGQAQAQTAPLLNQEQPPLTAGTPATPESEGALPLNTERAFPTQKGSARRVVQTIEATSPSGGTQRYDVIELRNDGNGQLKTSYQLIPHGSDRASMTGATSREQALAHLPKMGLTLARQSAPLDVEKPAEPQPAVAGKEDGGTEVAESDPFSPATPEERQVTQRREKLADPDFKKAMIDYRDRIGWAVVGERLFADGKYIGSTSYVPHPDNPWWAESKGLRQAKGLSEAKVRAALTRFNQGEAPESAAETALLDFLIDYDQYRQSMQQESAWIENQLTPEETDLLNRLTAELENHPAFGSAKLAEFLERISQKYENLTPAQFGRALILTYEAKLDALRKAQSAGRTERTTEGSPRPASESAGTPTGEPPLLTDYTLEELDAENARVQAELEKQRQADAAAEAKRQADKDVGGFTLSGSNRPADIAAAAGQEDLLAGAKEAPKADTVDLAEKAASRRNALLNTLEKLGWKRESNDVALLEVRGGTTGGELNPTGRRSVFVEFQRGQVRAYFNDGMENTVTVAMVANAENVAPQVLARQLHEQVIQAVTPAASTPLTEGHKAAIQQIVKDFGGNVDRLAGGRHKDTRKEIYAKLIEGTQVKSATVSNSGINAIRSRLMMLAGLPETGTFDSQDKKLTAWMESVAKDANPNQVSGKTDPTQSPQTISVQSIDEFRKALWGDNGMLNTALLPDGTKVTLGQGPYGYTITESRNDSPYGSKMGGTALGPWSIEHAIKRAVERYNRGYGLSQKETLTEENQTAFDAYDKEIEALTKAMQDAGVSQSEIDKLARDTIQRDTPKIGNVRIGADLLQDALEKSIKQLRAASENQIDAIKREKADTEKQAKLEQASYNAGVVSFAQGTPRDVVPKTTYWTGENVPDEHWLRGWDEAQQATKQDQKTPENSNDPNVNQSDSETTLEGDVPGSGAADAATQRPGERSPSGSGTDVEGDGRLGSDRNDDAGSVAGKPDAVGVQEPAAGLDATRDNDLDALWNSLVDEELGTPAPAKTPKTSAPRPRKQAEPKAPSTQRQVKEKAAHAVSELAKAADQATDGLLNMFFTPGKLGANLSIDAEQYERAKPMFLAAARHLKNAAADIAAILRLIIQDIVRKGKAAGMDDAAIRQGLERIAPYAKQFAKDVEEGVITLDLAAIPENPTQPKGAALIGENPGNYRITDTDRLGQGSDNVKVEQNIAAIRLVQQLEAENRYATREEQVVLAKYVGWGGLKGAFAPNGEQQSKWNAQLKALVAEGVWTQREYNSAWESTADAHYTSKPVIDAMYRFLGHMGFTGGRVLEPTVGVGNFIGLMPEAVAQQSQWFASEIDTITSAIAKHLYPDAQVKTATPFEEAEFPYGRFDLAIGNPPFGSLRITENKAQRKALDGWKIHNYVIGKSAMHLRQGGVMAMVVTHRFLDTMDSSSQQTREWLDQNMWFLGAVRLPNTAFKKNAGTDVVTDIVFFMRPDMSLIGKVTPVKNWTSLGSVMHNGQPVPVNQYFADNPQLMFGQPTMEGSMYGDKQEFTLKDTGIDIPAAFDRALQTDFAGLANILKEVKANQQDAPAFFMENREDISVGGYILENDKLYLREDNDQDGNITFTELSPNTQWTAKQTLGQSRYDRLKGLLQLRGMAYALIAAEQQDAPNMEALRATLRQRYQTFVKAFGPIGSSANARLLEDDPKIEFGLEKNFRKAIAATRAKKLGIATREDRAEMADILTKRVYYPYKGVTSAKDAIDGFQVSLSEKGRLDLDYIAELTTQNVTDVVDQLSMGDAPRIFHDPTTHQWVAVDEYLSGNVKKKLQEAQQAGLPANIRALEAVIPKDIKIDEIHVELGAPWVPARVYNDFLELLGVQKPSVLISSSGQLLLPNADSIAMTSNQFNADLQNNDMTVSEMFLNLANKQALLAYDYVVDENGNKKRVVNPERTKILQPLGKSITKMFADWVRIDPDRAALLEKEYNEKINTTVDREFDGKLLRTKDDAIVGGNPLIKLRPNQKRAAWRMIVSDNVLMDHVVGAGKTLSIIAGVMERRRTGLSKKPLVVVPNHLVGQWTKDFLELYPGARLLAANEKDFAPANRKKLMARMATGDYDAIIIGHSMLPKMPVNAETRTEFVENEIAFLVKIRQEMEAAGENKRKISGINKRIDGMRQKLREAIAKDTKDQVVFFEDTGIDYLVVDESHEFKNLMYHTNMTPVVGMGDPKGANKSFDLYMKTGSLRRRNGGITFATGTPISNSLVEMYTILRYLNPQGLAERNLESFDAWLKTFAGIEEVTEYTATGQLKARNVLTSFSGVPELLQIYRQFADTVTMEDLKRLYTEAVKASNQATGATEREDFPIPQVMGGGRQLVTVPISPAQRMYVDYLTLRAKKLEGMTGKERKEYAATDNPLWIYSDARKAALDIRVVDPTAMDEGNSKVNRAVDQIKRIYDRTADVKGTQLVFSDLSTPKKTADKEAKAFIKEALKVLDAQFNPDVESYVESLPTYREKWNELQSRMQKDMETADAINMDDYREKLEDYLSKVGDEQLSAITTADTGFSVYDDIREKLVKLGVPENEIAFVHEYNSKAEKTELFERVNAGEVRVLLGSTAKMGAGTNVQERAVALHHLDAPWRPSDMEQREGRIIRQKNKLYLQDPDGFRVEIYAYSTENTFDAVMWQILSRKAGALEQFRQGKRVVEEVNKDSASYADFMAETTGNPIFREKFEVQRKVDELDSQHNRTRMQVQSSTDFLARVEQRVKIENKLIQDAQETAKKLPTSGPLTVTLGKDAPIPLDVDAILEDETNKYRDELQQYYSDLGIYSKKKSDFLWFLKALPEAVRRKLTEAYNGKPLSDTTAWHSMFSMYLEDIEKNGPKQLYDKVISKGVIPEIQELGQPPKIEIPLDEPKKPVYPELDSARVRKRIPFLKELREKLYALRYETLSLDIDGIQIEIEKSAADKTKNEFAVSMDGREIHRYASENAVLANLKASQIKARLEHVVKESQRALTRLEDERVKSEVLLKKTNLDSMKAQLDSLKARYEEIIRLVNQAEADLAKERKGKVNPYVERDSSRNLTEPEDTDTGAQMDVDGTAVPENLAQPSPATPPSPPTPPDIAVVDASMDVLSHKNKGRLFQRDSKLLSAKELLNDPEAQPILDYVQALLTNPAMQSLQAVSDAMVETFGQKAAPYAKAAFERLMPNQGPVQPSRTPTPAPGLTRTGFVAALQRRFPHLSEALNSMLARGEKNQKGGLVLINSNDLDTIARVFAAKTGRAQDAAVQELRGENAINGLYDPRTGLLFAILPNLSEASAPGVFLHENVHAQQRADIDARAVELVASRERIKRPELRSLLNRVQARLEASNVANDPKEVSAYLIEELAATARLNGMSAADGKFLDWVDRTMGQSVGNWIRDVVKALRGWAFRHGFLLKASQLSLDDVLAWAEAGVQRTAAGDVRLDGWGNAPFSRSLTADELLAQIQSGQMDALTPEQWAQVQQAFLQQSTETIPPTGTQAPSFKTWFGASRIKDKTGQPLKMYHATDAEFTVFEQAKSGQNTTHPTAALGFFFTNDRGHAAAKYGSNLMEVYLSIENPYHMTDADLRKIDTLEDAKAFRERLEAQGYDGIVMPAETRTRYVAAFHADQIKRTDNATYTKGEKDIRFSKGKTLALTSAEKTAWATEALKLLVANPDIFQYPKSAKKEMADIAADLSSEIKVSAPDASRNNPLRANRRFGQSWTVTMPDGNTADVLTSKSGREVYIDASGLQEGKSFGSILYQLVGQWAHNNGKVFVGDPEGISAAGKARRLENLISLALKFGTTDFFMPHPDQNIPWKVSEHDYNVTQMLIASSQAIDKAIPDLKAIHYDFARREFIGASGNPFTDTDFALLAESPGARAARAGSATLKRSVLIHSLVQRAGGEGWRSVLEELAKQSSVGGLDPSLKKIFYSKSKTPAQVGVSASAITQTLIQPKLTAWNEAGLAVEVVQSVADLPTDLRARLNDDLVEGFYETQTGKVYLIADQLGSMDRAREVLKHEAVGHWSSHHLRAAPEFVQILKALNRLEAVGNQDIVAIAAQVDATQPGLDRFDRAEEIYSVAIERGLHEKIGLLRTWSVKLLQQVKAWLRKLGFDGRFINDITLNDVLLWAKESQRRLDQGGRGTDGKWAFAGSRGVSTSFAGEKARTADLSLLQQAKQRVDAGEDAETVRQDTGWFKGWDQKWRFEIDDRSLSVNRSVLDNIQLLDIHQPTLGQLVDHPELFQAYPALKSLPIAPIYFRSDVDGSYNPETKTILLSRRLNDAHLKETLIHEIQHAIQHYEGFASGGSANALIPDGLKEEQDIVNEKINKLRTDEQVTEALKRVMSVTGHSNINPSMIYSMLIHTISPREKQALRLMKADPVLREYLSVIANKYELSSIKKAAMRGYLTLAGEIEARDTGHRLNLTTEQRQAAPPYRDTMLKDGIADKDVIVRFEGGTADIRFSRTLPARQYEDAQGNVQDSQAFNPISGREEFKEQRTILQRLREDGFWKTVKNVTKETRPAWLKLLTLQQKVEMLQDIQLLNELATSFENTALAMDADKSNLKQEAFALAEEMRSEMVKARDKGYLLGRILQWSTLRNVVPYKVPERIFFGTTAEFVTATEDYQRLMEMVKKLETDHPALLALYDKIMGKGTVDANGQPQPNMIERMDGLYRTALQERLGRQALMFLNTTLESAQDTRAQTLWQQLHTLAQRDPAAYAGLQQTYQAFQAVTEPTPAQLAAWRDSLSPDVAVLWDELLIRDGRMRNRRSQQMIQEMVDAAVNPKKLPRPGTLAAALRTLHDQDVNAYQELRDALKLRLEFYRPTDDRHTEIKNRLPPSTQALFEQITTANNAQTAKFSLNSKLETTRTTAPAQEKSLTGRLHTLFLQSPDRFAALAQAVTTRLQTVNMGAAAVDVLRNRLPDPTDQALFDELAADMQAKVQPGLTALRELYESRRNSGPYFPLDRFGPYQVYAERAGNGKDGIGLPAFSTFETEAEQQRAVKMMRAEGWTVRTNYQIRDALETIAPPNTFIARMFKQIDQTEMNEAERQALKDDIYQMYLQSLPELSARKHFMKRKGIPGFSGDALRSFAQLMNSKANSIARLRHSDQLTNALETMEKVSKAMGQDPTQLANQNRARMVIEELKDSYSWMMNPSNATWANRLTSLGFFWYLTNISTSLVNLTQVPIWTFPELGAKFGAGRSFAALNKTIAEYGVWKLRRGETGRKLLERLRGEFNGELGLDLDRIERDGIVSRTQAVTLAGMGEDAPEFKGGAAGTAAAGWKWVFDKVSWPFHKTEVANREISFITAYRLARTSEQAQAIVDKMTAGGSTPDTINDAVRNYAYETARNVVLKTQGNYANYNRAPVMRSNIMRVVTLFRSYSQMMTWRMLRDTYQAFKVADPQEKAEVRKRLGLMLASSFLWGGAMALPIYTIAMSLAGLLFGNDPDDPYDPEEAMRQALQGLLGETGQRVLMGGAVGQLPKIANLIPGIDGVTGIDLSPRVSADLVRLWMRKMPGDLEGESAWDWYVMQAMGPMAGMARNAFRAYSDLVNSAQGGGSLLRGLEGTMPAPIRNVLKAARFEEEGVATRRGDLLVPDMNWAMVVQQAVGFTPDTIAAQYAQNTARYEFKDELQKRRKGLTDRYIFALHEKDTELRQETLEFVKKFNRLNPETPITAQSLKSAYGQWLRARQLSEGGVYEPSKGMRARLKREFAEEEAEE